MLRSLGFCRSDIIAGPQCTFKLQIFVWNFWKTPTWRRRRSSSSAIPTHMADWKRFQLFICSVVQILGIFIKVQITHIHVFCDIFHIKVVFWSTTKLYPLSDSFFSKSWLRKICKFSLGFFPGITLTKPVRAVLIWHDYCFSNPKSNHFLFFSYFKVQTVNWRHSTAHLRLAALVQRNWESKMED